MPQPCEWIRGPLKLHFDENDLPPLDTLVTRIDCARAQGRNVAAHCVTQAELMWYLTAIEQAGGPRLGDRIEHGGVIPQAVIARIAHEGYRVVSNPSFIARRGDRYLDQVPATDRADLYRLASLARSGVMLAAGSDAPYGITDPWQGMTAAATRRTRGGAVIGATERLAPDAALDLYLADFSVNHRRRVAPGETADLCLLEGSPDAVLLEPDADRVRTTIVAGRALYQR